MAAPSRATRTPTGQTQPGPELAPRTRAFSRATLTHIVMPADTNEIGYLHGGLVATLMDKLATVVAMRHAGRTTVTRSLSAELITPVRLSEVLVLNGWVESVGRTSLVVVLEGEAENPRERRPRLANRGRVVFVGVDSAGKPVPVPPLVEVAD